MALNLIKVNEFPESGDPKNWIVVADNHGVSYKISKENLKAYLGTIQSIVPEIAEGFIINGGGVEKLYYGERGDYILNSSPMTANGDINLLLWDTIKWTILEIDIDLQDYVKFNDMDFSFKSLDFSEYIKDPCVVTSAGDEVLSVPGFIGVYRMPVKPNTDYSIRGVKPYQQDRNIVQRASNGDKLVYSAITPFGYFFKTLPETKYISFTLKSYHDEGEGYEPISLLEETGEVHEVTGIMGYRIMDESLTSEFGDFKNMKIDISGFIIKDMAVSGAGDYIPYPVYVSAINIPVQQGIRYTISGIASSDQLDKYFTQKNASGVSVKTVELTKIPYSFIPEPGVETIGFTIKGSTESDDWSLDNYKFTKTIDSLSELNIESSDNKWKGKKGVSFGDSITWYDGKPYWSNHTDYPNLAIGYQSYLRENLGCIIDNQGQSSIDMTQIQSIIKSYNFADIDFVTITSGVNDHRKGVIPGVAMPAESSFDLYTYSGALQSSIEFILNQNKKVKIFLMTPVQGWFTENHTSEVPDAYKGEMFVSPEYAQAMIDVGNVYAIPVCDWYTLSRINKIVMHEYMGDTIPSSMYVHPNNKGYKLMGEILYRFFLNY